MKLSTQVPIKKQIENPIDYHSKIFGVGSCFVENIGEKLDYYKFKTFLNPFGILFNPVSIENFLHRSIAEEGYTSEETFEQNEIYRCFDAHSDLNGNDEDNLLNNLNQALAQTLTFIKDATHLIITLGTAWVYEHKENKNIVANCHKVPQKNFNKKLLGIDEIQKSLLNIITKLHIINPNLNLIFTVSPVRHLKDGFIENTLSKAHLISAVHFVINEKERYNYFPAYEIVMDELRDYRFYDRDLLHPNELGIDIIWEKFKDNWISEQSYDLMKRVEKFQKNMAHRPMKPYSLQHQKFVSDLEQEKLKLAQDLPHIEF